MLVFVIYFILYNKIKINYEYDHFLQWPYLIVFMGERHEVLWVKMRILTFLRVSNAVWGHMMA
jgi:hypothetical protein